MSATGFAVEAVWFGSTEVDFGADVSAGVVLVGVDAEYRSPTIDGSADVDAPLGELSAGEFLSGVVAFEYKSSTGDAGVSTIAGGTAGGEGEAAGTSGTDSAGCF